MIFVSMALDNLSKFSEAGYVLSGCAPSQLLHSCSLGEYEKLEKVLDFIATTENIRVINILLILNSKHCEENYLYPSQNQDIIDLHLDIETLTTIPWMQPSSQFLIHPTVHSSYPYLSNLERRMLWGTMSMALEKST